ncbi:hypothetical protein AWV80_36210 [Cupriavidus sp. UYMU48A]|nr:hypothetical protein AWV80_36210 [Cupriavidus sp. UYMU48A]
MFTRSSTTVMGMRLLLITVNVAAGMLRKIRNAFALVDRRSFRMVHIHRLLIFFAVATLAWAAAVFSASPGTDAEHNTPEEFLLSASGQASCPSPKFGLRSKDTTAVVVFRVSFCRACVWDGTA